MSEKMFDVTTILRASVARSVVMGHGDGIQILRYFIPPLINNKEKGEIKRVNFLLFIFFFFSKFFEVLFFDIENKMIT